MPVHVKKWLRPSAVGMLAHYGADSRDEVLDGHSGLRGNHHVDLGRQLADDGTRAISRWRYVQQLDRTKFRWGNLSSCSLHDMDGHLGRQD